MRNTRIRRTPLAARLRWPRPVFLSLKHSLRGLTRSPAYALTMIALLAISIGATTGIFEVARAVLIRSVPYPSPERVVSLRPAPVVRDDDMGWRVDPDFEEVVDGVALYIPGGGAVLDVGAGGQRIALAQVTRSFFDVLQVRPMIGQGFREENGSSRAVMLSHRLWVRGFGADPAVVAGTVSLNGESYQVAGVMPPDVVFPSTADVWIPFPIDRGFYSGPFGPRGLARLPPGLGTDEVGNVIEARMQSRRAEAPNGTRREPPPVEVTSVRDELTGALREPLLALLGIATLVMFLGCLNLAGAALARTGAREREFVVRRALGARRIEIFAGLVAETLALSLVAGLASLVTASWTVQLVRAFLQTGLPTLDTASVGGSAVLLAGGLAVTASLFVGLFPALHGALLAGAAVQGGRATLGIRQRRFQSGLVVGQVAVAFVLVMGANLLGMSLAKLQSVPLGYDVEHVLTFTVRLPEHSYPDEGSRGTYLTSLRQRLEALPGVASVGATSRLPLRAEQGWADFAIRTDDDQGASDLEANWIFADAEYLDAMDIHVVEGRPFEVSTEGGDAWSRITLNASLAAHLFGEEPAVGQPVQIRFASGWTDATVEAVVDDVRFHGPDQAASSVFYTDLDAFPVPWMGIAVRGAGDPEELVAAARQAVHATDPTLPGDHFSTTTASASLQLASRRAVAALGWAFSLLALGVSAMGVAALVAHGIVRRRRELGVRMSLGAPPGSLTWSATAGPLKLVGVGIVAGSAASLVTGSALTSLLYEVEATDPRIWIGAVALIVLTAVISAWIPARRVRRLDPAEVLGAE
jgi:predicted permease